MSPSRFAIFTRRHCLLQLEPVRDPSKPAEVVGVGRVVHAWDVGIESFKDAGLFVVAIGEEDGEGNSEPPVREKYQRSTAVTPPLSIGWMLQDTNPEG